MDTPELNDAIKKLQSIHRQGLKLRNLGRKLSSTATERERKSVEFAKSFTPEQLAQLIKLCTQRHFCPEFGTVVRLFKFKPRERNQLLKQVVEERLTKADLDAELELRKPTGSAVDHKRRGRQPKAAKSLHALKGQAAVDARRWAHISDLLEQDDAVFNLSSNKQKDLKKLVELLQQLSQW